MVKYSKYNLTKLEEMFTRAGYKIRYEKGTFTSGYCVINDQKVIIINKFFTTEARINCLFEIYEHMIDTAFELTETDRKIIGSWNKSKAEKDT